MTKPEMIDKLNEAGLGSKASLKKLEPAELEVMVAGLTPEGESEVEVPQTPEPLVEVPESEETPVVEPEIEPVVEPEIEPVVEPEEEVELSVVKHQLGIFTEFIYNLKHKGAKIKFENIGNGDVYVSDERPIVGNKAIRVFTGDQKVFEGVSIIRAIAASQPEIKITEIK